MGLYDLRETLRVTRPENLAAELRKKAVVQAYVAVVHDLYCSELSIFSVLSMHSEVSIYSTLRVCSELSIYSVLSMYAVLSILYIEYTF